jgi:hypothetical protein
MPWITAIIGVEINVSQSMEYPVDAPATEYVEIPEGSSSAAPVMSPGARTLKKPAIRAGIARKEAAREVRALMANAIPRAPAKLT